MNYAKPGVAPTVATPPEGKGRDAVSGGPPGVSLPQINLPKGGGAIRGIGEKFGTNPVTGTANATVPIFTSPGRSGFHPELALSYDSGAGNGPFGFGWHLSVPHVTRKTDKGLPRYSDGEESDVFLLSDAEDLVPAYHQTNEGWTKVTVPSQILGTETFDIVRHRPRIEGLFARIERWRSRKTGISFWKSVTKGNVTSVFGSRDESRIADPEEPSRVFTWLLDLTYDDRGNSIRYDYKLEDRKSVPVSLSEERREARANRYLKRIWYGNRTPYGPPTAPALPEDWWYQPLQVPTISDDWCFELVFDYGEHDPVRPTPDDQGVSWICRPDPFSRYRSCFEVRTYRLCRRVLMFHRFEEELGPEPYLVRSTDFTYAHEAEVPDPHAPGYSLLASATQQGHARNPDGTYRSKAFPAVEFEYSKPEVQTELQTVDPHELENVPAGVDGGRFEWADLDGEGSPGILSRQDGAWYYKRNDSNLPSDDNGNGASSWTPTPRFEPLESVGRLPSSGVGARVQLMDLAGDGRLSAVQFAPPLAGYFERDEDVGGWQPYAPFASTASIDWGDPNLRTLDLDGDGFADVLIARDEAFTWYPSRATLGFGPPERAPRAWDENRGPALVFAEETQTVFLADMTGDGLTDLVRIRNGELCYWPNLGFGRFGPRVAMENAPVFDCPELFDPKGIRLADVDGSGTADLLYVGRGKVTLWFNQSGNAWGAQRELPQITASDEVDSVQALDLLGNGTACLVWSSALPANSGRALRYLDLMGGQKPHLLVSTRNNLGAETRVQYAASTQFYLRDRAEGHPWLTRLAFPVHVVQRVETFDRVGKTKLVTLYRYHHGYYDGPEREFRGFGMVEQWDTESFSKYSGTGLFTDPPVTEGEEFHLPPVHTKTWFHTGLFLDEERISKQFAPEYWHGDPQALVMADSGLPDALTSAQEVREACRALKGSALRQEVYADDGKPESNRPYAVTEHRYKVRKVQPLLGANRHAVFFTHGLETLSFHYERNPADPRVGHEIILEVDEFGAVTKSASVGYPRRVFTYPEQGRTWITASETDVINRPDEADWYRVGVPYQARAYELTGIKRTGALYAAEELLEALQTAQEIPYEAVANLTDPQKRLIDQSRTLYLKNDLSGPLPLGQLDSLAIPWKAFKLAFTPGLIGHVYGGRVDDVLLQDGNYENADGDGRWWVPSGTVIYPDFAWKHFYLPQGAIDAFNNVSRVAYDERYHLAVIRAQDPLDNVTTAEIDYRVLQPRQVTDPNLNRTAAAFDELGMMVANAVMGKEGANEGDTLADPTARLEYELFNWQDHRQPNFVHSFAREKHGAANPRWQEAYAYSDGLGREVMRKVQAEPGLAPVRDANGALVRDTNGKLVQPQVTQSRWIGTGRTVFDNKGNPIKKYEPFFDSNPEYEDEKELVELGVTPLLRYDPLGRLIRADNPNGTFFKVEFDPWRQVTSDENDTVLESRWYQERGAPDPNGAEPKDPESRAAYLAAKHANTPTITHLDSLARTFLTIADNGGTEKYETRVDLDVESNQRSVTDALGRKAMVYDYDMLSARLHQNSIDAGERWMLADADGKTRRGWDSRGHVLRHEYDKLRRPIQFWVREGQGPERMAEKAVYGEKQPDDQKLNLRGKPFQQYDGAGVVTNKAYDFKGNLLGGTRQLLKDYKNGVDWSQTPSLEVEAFASATSYDALNRPIQLITPHAASPGAKLSFLQPGYNEANLLETLNVWLQQTAEPNSLLAAATASMHAVTNVDYNAKGQREKIEYGNRVITTYSYDKDTFRLTRLLTVRPQFGENDKQSAQDLRYTYDPVGNIMRIEDDADLQNIIYFKNQRVEPSAAYEYDAVYRLIKATGREHLGQTNGQLNPARQITEDDSFRCNHDLPQPGNSKAMGNYTEKYEYDFVGNILRMAHATSSEGWTRRYQYGPSSNRLLATSLPGDVDGQFSAKYAYDAHGNMTQMPQLTTMEWDFKDQLYATQRQVVNEGPGEKTYYVYDASGQRVRKVTERQTGKRKAERIYVGGFEVYREYSIEDSVTLERETLHVMDDKRRVAIIEIKTVDISAPPNSLPSRLSRYQFDNHLGSACLELDENAAVISYEEYYPYGSTSYQANRGSLEVSAKRYRYNGKERDEESGLYYCKARYYSPWLGRWISADPTGIADGNNAFCYVRNRPIVLVDPNGTQSIPFLPDLSAVGRSAIEEDKAELDKRRVEEHDARLEAEVKDREKFLQRRHLVVQTIGMGERWETGGTGAVAGAVLANWTLGIKPGVEDAAALSHTIANSSIARLAGQQIQASQGGHGEATPSAAQQSGIPGRGAPSDDNDPMWLVGQRTEKLKKEDPAAKRYKYGISRGTEIGYMRPDKGTPKMRLGTAESVEIPFPEVGTKVVESSHTHPADSPAIFSRGDVKSIVLKTDLLHGPDVINEVVGARYPRANRVVMRLNSKIPNPIEHIKLLEGANRTTVIQSQVSGGNIRNWENRPAEVLNPTPPEVASYWRNYWQDFWKGW